MDTPFRNDADALKTRLTSLNEEVDSLRAKAREYEAVRERLSSLEREQDEVRREIEARSVRRPTPLVDTLRVASPCHEKWEDMTGDERSRFCGKCEKDVHNISALTRDEAEAFLESVTSSICVRIYQRADGTVLTADCPVGVRKKRVKRLFLATVGGGLAAAAGVLAFWRYEETMVMGQMPTEMGKLEASYPDITGTAAPSVAPAPEVPGSFSPPQQEPPHRVTAGVRPMPRTSPTVAPQPPGKASPMHHKFMP